MKIVNMINPAYQLADPGKVKGTDSVQIEKAQGNPNVDHGAGGSVVKDGVVVYKLYDEIGATGTKIFSGIIDDEYLKEWKNPIKRCEIVNRMLKSDATVKAIQLVLTLPLESARWSIDIDEDAGDEEREIMDVVDDMIFHEMSIPWQDTLRQILSFLPYGFSVFEKVWQRDEKRNMVKLRKLAPRLQSTIKKWFTDETGGLSAIEQRAYYTTGEKTIYRTVVIPVDKLAVFSYRQEGSNFEGESILRAAYKHWFIKDKLYLIQAVGLERHALGIPVITLPRGASPDDKSYAKQIVKSWRAHEEAGAVFPEGVKIENITGTVQSQVLKQAIDHHDAEIAKSVLAQFIQLGTGGQSGSWALSKDQSDFLLMTLNGIAQYLCDRMTEYVIKPFVKMNWGERDFYPKMKCEEISKSNNMETLAAIQQLVGLQLIQPDGKLEEWARRVFNLPAKDEPTFEDYMKQMQSQQLMGQMNDANPTPEQGQEVQAPAGNAKQPKQAMQAGPPAAAGGSVKASDDAIKNVKTTIQDLIKLKENLVGIGSLTDESTLDGALESGWNETINDHVPRIVNEIQNQFGELDSQQQSYMKNFFIQGLETSKAKMMNYIKSLVNSALSGFPRKMSERTFSRYRFNDEMGNAVMKGQMDAAFGHEMAPMVNTMIDQHDRANPITQSELTNQPPPPGAMHAKAPVYRDGKTGRYKYAKGAMIDGQHVGGQWADIGAGVGVGSTMGIMGIGALMHGLKSQVAKDLKVNTGRTMSQQLAHFFVPEGSMGNGIMKAFGYKFLDDNYKHLYKKNPVQVSAMFSADVNSMPGMKTGRALKETINDIGGFKTPSGREGSMFNSKGLNMAVDFDKFDPVYEMELRAEDHVEWEINRRAADVGKIKTDVHGAIIEPPARDYIYKGPKHAGYVKGRTVLNFASEQQRQFWNNMHDLMEKRLESIKDATDKISEREKFHEWERWLLDTGRNKKLAAAGKATHPLTKPSHSFFVSLMDIVESKEPWPTMSPKTGMEAAQRAEGGIKTMIDLFADHGIEGLEKIDHSNSYIKMFRHVNGGLAKTAFASFAILSATYLLTSIWKNMAKKATRVMQDKIRTSRYDVLSPEEAMSYQAAYEDWKRVQSPTGGAVGRPRTRVEIPPELRRGRGRPPLDEARKEEFRKKKIADLEVKFKKEQEAKRMEAMGNVSTIQQQYPIGGQP